MDIRAGIASMTGCRDLKPEQLAELEQAMYRAQAEVRGDAASIAKPWPLRRVSYGDLPVSAAAYFPPLIRSDSETLKSVIRTRPPSTSWLQLGKAEQQRRERWTIGICIAVLAAPGIIAAVRWLWT